MKPPADLLRESVSASLPFLGAIGEEQSAEPRAPGRWSPREVIGHLIDSAANNHVRFLRGQLEEDLVFPGYEQEGFVRVQGYARAALAGAGRSLAVLQPPAREGHRRDPGRRDAAKEDEAQLSPPRVAEVLRVRAGLPRRSHRRRRSTPQASPGPGRPVAGGSARGSRHEAWTLGLMLESRFPI